MDLIKIAEEAFATGKQHPSFKAGDCRRRKNFPDRITGYR